MTTILRRLFGPRPVPAPEPTPVPAGIDPFADHPMSCKCYFHR